MSLVDMLHRRNPRPWSWGRLLVGAWAILVATSFFTTGCSPAIAHVAGQAPELAVTGGDGSTAARHANCCQEIRTASLDCGAWGPAPLERSGSTPVASVDRGAAFPPAVAGTSARGDRERVALASPVPTYLLTLRLRA